MSNPLEIEATSSTTNIYGAKGKYRLPNNKVTVGYFQTVIDNKSSEGKALLESLKPIREHIEISKINNLEDILQRDISDKRVAESLIPYLVKESLERIPKFFPSIVIVLMPKTNFNGTEIYPNSSFTKENDKPRTQFEKYWSIEDYAGNISMLKIDLQETAPLVIDGQHRTAAFKFLSNKQQHSGNNQIYSHFYSGVNDLIPDSFDSSIPATIIWFEDTEGHDIKIKEFSRRIFLDINQSSQNISYSRKILLDADEPSGVLTRAFYDYVAKNISFQPNQSGSLFYYGFDYPYNIKNGPELNIQSIFNPELLSYALEWLFLGSPTYDKIEKTEIGREVSQSRQNESKFDQYFDERSGDFLLTITDIEDNKKIIVNKDRIDSLLAIFNRSLAEPLLTILQSNPLYKAVYDGNSVVFDLYEKESEPFDDPTGLYKMTYEKVFMASEGLHYEIASSVRGDQLKRVKKVAGKIELLILEKIASEVGLGNSETKQILKSIKSIAFLTGYVQTLHFLANSRQTNLKVAANELKRSLVDIPAHDLAVFISKLKKSYLDGIDPKKWPRYRNIFLRFVHEKNGNIYGRYDNTLEAQIEENILNKRLKAHSESKNIPIQDLQKDIKNHTWQLISQSEYLEFKDGSNKSTQEIFASVESLNYLTKADFNEN